MNIAVVIPSFYPAFVYGGTIFSSLSTCKELVKLGHEVRVSTTNTNMYSRLEVPVNTWLKVEGMNVKYYNETIVDKLSLALVFSVWKDIRKADVVHIQAIFNTPVPVSLLYARLMKKPVLLSPRGVMGDWVMNQGNGFKKAWLKFLIKPFANSITWHATADQEKKEILNQFPKANIVVVENGIDLEAFKHPDEFTKKDFMKIYTGTSLDPSNIIISMGRIHKKKGFDILIQSFKIVKETLPESVLIIAGQDEGERMLLIKQIQELQLENSCFIIDSISNQQKVNFLANADVFALTSHNENFGNVYAEALASGTPVIASIHTPWQDIEEAGCGHWVKLDPVEIAGAIADLIQNINSETNKKCIQFVSSFSWESVAKRLDIIYNNLLND